MRECPLLMTLREAADRLGMPQLRLLRHVTAGRLRVSGQTVTGKMLFSEYQVAQFAYKFLIEGNLPRESGGDAVDRAA